MIRTMIELMASSMPKTLGNNKYNYSLIDNKQTPTTHITEQIYSLNNSNQSMAPTETFTIPLNVGNYAIIS